jgi:glycosyltransferase involved in cell wall biosynthesis
MTDPLGQSQVIPYLQGLSKLGYRYTLISFEKKDRFKKSGDHIHAILKNSDIRWEPLFFTTRPPILSKLYDVWKMHRHAIKLHRRENFSFLHCRSYVPAGTGLVLLKKFKIPFLFDMRGLWVDERVDSGQWKLGNPFYKLLFKTYKAKERHYFDKATHIISLTFKGKDELTKTYNVPAEKITVIPCCVDLLHFDYNKIPAEKIKEKRRLLGIEENEKVITYLGSLGGWYLLDEMLYFFTHLKRKVPSLKFLFITQDKSSLILTAAAKRNIPPGEIIVLPASREEVPFFLALSDWNIFFIKDGYSKKASSPTKQGEVMAMGIPIICNDVGDTGKIIKESNAGFVVEALTGEKYDNIINSNEFQQKKERLIIRNAAFTYYDLRAGITEYDKVYASWFK